MKAVFSSIILVISAVFFVPNQTKAQKTTVFGTVFDRETGETIPYANVSFKGSSVGGITDYKGFFFIETTHATDTIMASYLGYEMDFVAVKKGQQQEIMFYLSESSVQIEEVVVTPGRNPAHAILDNIYERKKINNPYKFDKYQYKLYNKLRLDLNNVDSNLMSNRMLKQFSFVFDYVDSSDVFGKTYLPVLITESVSRFYYQKSPRVEKEVIEAFKMSGIDNNTFSQFTGKMYQKLNVYEDFMTLFEPGFVSPIADFGKLYYKYYLEDSATIDDSWCYKVSFKPKRKRERTFFGYFWVADTSWAIKKIQLRVSNDVNINFVNDLLAVSEFQKLNDTTWFMQKEEFVIDFNLGDESYGFFGRRSATFDDIVLNEDVPEEVAKLNTDTYVMEDSVVRNEDYWAENRKLDLKQEEVNVYEMVDSIKQVPLFKTLYGFAEMLFNYYYEVGKFEIGPYHTLYSFNSTEGHRFKFGGRTSRNFSTKYRLGGHIAFGSYDQEFKYGLTGEYLFDKNPRRKLNASWYHDISQLGKSEFALMDDNIISTVLRRRDNDKLTMIGQYNASYEHEWYQGLSNELKLKHQTVHATSTVPFVSLNEDGDSVRTDRLYSSEITLGFHFSYQEKFLLGKFDRVSLGSKYPTFDLALTFAPKGLLGSDYEYMKVKATLSDKVEINPMGFLEYKFTGGKIYGTLPYPLLELHEGNETYANIRSAYNLMNYYEFASDEYFSIFAEHHFQGFFLSRIPLIRFLELREVVGVKFLAGRLTRDHQSVMLFPEKLNPLTVPYSEASVGIENILKLFRLDATWRLTYRNNPEIFNFNILASMQLKKKKKRNEAKNREFSEEISLKNGGKGR